MVRVETPLLVLGPGPGALVAAKVAGACGQPCLLVGHDLAGGETPVALDATAVALLAEHGVLDVLRPCLLAGDPPSIAPRQFEAILKQHCVADLNVGVYDRMEVVDRVVVGRSLRGILTGGTRRWELVADAWIDGAALAMSLPAAIGDGVAAAREAITMRRS